MIPGMRIHGAHPASIAIDFAGAVCGTPSPSRWAMPALDTGSIMSKIQGFHGEWSAQMKPIHATVAILIALATGPVVMSQSVTLADSVLGSWTIIDTATPSHTSLSTSPTSVYGNPAPSLAVTSDTLLFNPGQTAMVAMVGTSALSFDPVTTGYVTSVDITYQAACVFGNCLSNCFVTPIVRQGANYYTANAFEILQPYFLPQVVHSGVLPVDFGLPFVHPDPCAGAPWEFGFKFERRQSGCTCFGFTSPHTFYVDNVTIIVHFVPGGCVGPHSGTLEDLLLSTGVNASPLSWPYIKSAQALDFLSVLISSPGNTFTYQPVLLAGQLIPTGQYPAPIPGLPFVHIDPLAAFILLGGATPIGWYLLPPGGGQFTSIVPPGLTGASILLQGAALTGAAANSYLATTFFHEIRIQ